MRPFHMLFLSIVFAVVIGCDACHHTRPDTPADGPDPDAVMAAIADGVGAGGEALQANAEDWAQCIAGVSMQAWADYTIGVAIPIRQSIEAGTCEGEIAGVVIDPGPCSGLPGEPTAETAEVTSEQLEGYLAMALPVASSLASAGATSASARGDTCGCVALSLVADLLSPAGEAVGAVLSIVEEPGSSFVSPSASWDCSACLPGS